jgi:MFS family permease
MSLQSLASLQKYPRDCVNRIPTLVIIWVKAPKRVAETLAPAISLLSFGRFLSGIGSGAAIVVGPIYISEVAPPSARGLFGAFTQISPRIKNTVVARNASRRPYLVAIGPASRAPSKPPSV